MKVTREVAAENVRQNQERYKTAYNKHAGEAEFVVGQTVLLRRESME